MISMMSRRSVKSPSSSKPSKRSVSTRSAPSCSAPKKRALTRNLRSSMQNIGGVSGLRLFCAVK